MPACHAGGHEFESRTHRKDSETNECLRLTKPTKSMICGLCFFYLVPFRRQTNAPFRQSGAVEIGSAEKPNTRSDANARRPECVCGLVYRSLYDRYKDELSSDSRKRQVPSWLKRLQIIDSTTITLFSNLVF